MGLERFCLHLFFVHKAWLFFKVPLLYADMLLAVTSIKGIASSRLLTGLVGLLK